MRFASSSRTAVSRTLSDLLFSVHFRDWVPDRLRNSLLFVGANQAGHATAPISPLHWLPLLNFITLAAPKKANRSKERDAKVRVLI